MTTLREWFDEFSEATSEPVNVIIFGRREPWQDQWGTPEGVVDFGSLGPEVLDREFDDGFGGNESPNLCAWSDSWVLFSDDYDGAESLQSVPRNPKEHDPIRPGGG